MDPSKAIEINGDDDEDEVMRQAIALSLGQTPSKLKASSDDPIDLTDSPPSLSDVQHSNVAATSSQTAAASQTQSSAPAAPTPVVSSSSVFGGIDRKKMEEERLARLQKRKAADLEDGSEDQPRQRPKVSESSRPSGIVPPHLRQAIADSSASRSTGGILPKSTTTGKASSTPQPQASGSSAVGPGQIPQFPKGVVKRTWLRGEPRTLDDIKIEEIFQKDCLELAVLSSYVWDTDWLWEKIDPEKTKITMIAFPGNEVQKAELVESAKGVVRLCFPPMAGSGSWAGSMHSKLQLLKFPGYLRVAVPSANLISFDWGETGVMENVVFIIDLPPLKSDHEKRESDETWTPFAEELAYFLTAQGLDDSLVKSLRKYDFSETSRYAFVHTIAGSHTLNESWRRTGYCGLGRAVQNLGLSTGGGPVQVDFVASSIGSLNLDIMTALYNACTGDSGMKEYEARAAKSKASSRSSKAGGASADQTPPIQANFRIYFPTHETVAASRGGVDNGGTIWMQSKWWNSPTFPREIFRDLKNPRRVLVHSKMMFVRPEAGDPAAKAWAYVGSANVSESAWGKLVQDRTSSKKSKVKMSCKNWECGVVVPTLPRTKPSPVVSDAKPNKEKMTDARSIGRNIDQELADVFRGSVPLPMELPGAKYVSTDGNGKQQTKRPWFMQG